MRLATLWGKRSSSYNSDQGLSDKKSLLELADLDHSFTLLKETTTAVSIAAAEAAKTLDKRLNESLHRFMSTIDALQDIILIKDPQGKWTTLNRFGQTTLGMLHGEYYLKTDPEIAVLFPHLKDGITQCAATDEQAWELGKTIRTEEKITLNNGSVLYLDMMKTPVFTAEGERKELIIVGRDVTELTLKQTRTRACFTALNSASDGIVIIDSKQKIYFSNDKFLEMFGIEDYHDANHKRLCDIIPNIPDYDKMWETVQQNKIWSMQCPHSFIRTAAQPPDCDRGSCPLQGLQFDVVPMMNGQPHPIYYICTLKPLKENRYANI